MSTYVSSYAYPINFGAYTFSYTPIAIQYLPAVVAEEGTNVISNAIHRLEITSPISKLPGINQALPTKASVIIPIMV